MKPYCFESEIPHCPRLSVTLLVFEKSSGTYYQVLTGPKQILTINVLIMLKVDSALAKNFVLGQVVPDIPEHAKFFNCDVITYPCQSLLCECALAPVFAVEGPSTRF